MSAINAVTDLTVEEGVAVLTVNAPPVNAITESVAEGLFEGFKAALSDPAVSAVVLACEGRTFIAGVDIRSFDRPRPGRSLSDLLQIMEEAKKPLVAAIHGTALGGGLEVALCCHYRIGVPSAKCSLPEVKLGLIPAAGGTQRLTRLIGARRTLELVTSGDSIDALEALKLGLLDALADEGTLLEGACRFAARLAAEGRPLRRIRDLPTKPEISRFHSDPIAAFRAAHPACFDGAVAVEAAVRAIEAAVTLPFEEGLKVEREAFRELVDSPQSAALRYLFFAERRAAGPPAPIRVLPRAVERVGIVGSGPIAASLVTKCLDTGLVVDLHENGGENSALALVTEEQQARVRLGAMTRDESVRRLRRLTSTSDVTVQRYDLIVLADASSASSSFPTGNGGTPVVVDLRPDDARSVTMFGPVVRARLYPPGSAGTLAELEWPQEAPAAVLSAVEFLRRLDKTCVLLPHRSGSAIERLSAARHRLEACLGSRLTPSDGAAAEPEGPVSLGVACEAAWMLATGAVFRGSDIDVLLTAGLDWPRQQGGPVFQADRLGLAAVVSRLDALRLDYGEAFAPPPLLTWLATAGHLLAAYQSKAHLDL